MPISHATWQSPLRLNELKVTYIEFKTQLLIITSQPGKAGHSSFITLRLTEREIAPKSTS